MTRARSHAAHRLKLTRTGFFLVFEGGGQAGGEERSGRLLVELHGLTGARRNINDFEFVQLLFACHHMRGGSESNVLRSTGASSVRVCECTDVLGHVRVATGPCWQGTKRRPEACWHGRHSDGAGRYFCGTCLATCSGRWSTFCRGARSSRRHYRASGSANAHAQSRTRAHTRAPTHTPTLRRRVMLGARDPVGAAHHARGAEAGQRHVHWG